MITKQQHRIEVDKIKGCLTSALHAVAKKLQENKIIYRSELQQLLEEKYKGEIYLSFIELFTYDCTELKEIKVYIRLNFISEVIHGFSCKIEGGFHLKPTANSSKESLPIPHYLYANEHFEEDTY